MASSASEGNRSVREGEFVFSPPVSTDGLRVHRLIAACPPLDENSVYCNLVQCHHFADTSVKVERDDGEMVAFISGYIPPREPNVLFIWQVAVSEAARGQGMGKRMLNHLADRLADRGVNHMHTTVTPSNEPSMGMFLSFARDRDAPVNKSVLFSGDDHFGGDHEDEVLFSIGPWK